MSEIGLENYNRSAIKMTQVIRYSIIVPCYKSGAWLEELVTRLEGVMSPLGKYEIILVNDKSPDDITWPNIVKLANANVNVRGLDMLYNVGQFRASLCGIEKAIGDYIITLDDDLQHPPEEIPKLVREIQLHPELDCIMGRYDSKKHSFIRNIGSRLFHRLLNFLYHKDGSVVTTSFRIMTARFAHVLVSYRCASPQLGPLITGLSNKICNITVEHHPRPHGKSGYGFFRCVKETYQSIINASVFPLRLFSIIGGLASLSAFAISAFYFIRWMIYQSRVPGYTSLILTISFFSGLLLLGIGILGEYIGRLLGEMTGLPRYMIARDTLNP